MAYSVTTPVFEGPIDLLLHLVSTHELDVLDLPLAPVVDQFVQVLVDARDTLSIDTLSEFLLVAAILVELKSQRLLPGDDELEADEELGRWEERDLLLARLLECRAYAEVAELLVQLARDAARCVPREVGLDEGFVVNAPSLLVGVTPEHLAQAYLKATAERPVPVVDLSHVTVDTATVAEAVEELATMLPVRRRTSFRALTEHLSTRIEIIVRFLALLELCKLGLVDLGQGETFGDLSVAWIGEDEGMVAVGAGAIDTYEG